MRSVGDILDTLAVTTGTRPGRRRPVWHRSENRVIASADPRFLVRRAPDGLRIPIGLGNRPNAGKIVCTDEPTWRADSGRISFSKLHPCTVLIV